MPFKTRKRKESAGKRRFSITSEGTISYGETTRPDKEQSAVSAKKTASIENSYDYVSRDLFKILTTAGVIVLVQISLKFIKLPFLN